MNAPLQTELTWEHLGQGKFGLDATTPGVDPMWLWADATCYRDHAPGGIDTDASGVWCVVEHEQAPCGNRWRSVRLTPHDWPRFRDGQDFGSRMHCIELAEPVVPERPRPARVVHPVTGLVHPELSDAETLVGVIDSGCPFASLMLRAADRRTTRVLGLWDQDDSPAFGCWGGRPADFGYGRAIGRHAMNRLMSMATSRDGELNEELCYSLADYRTVHGRFSHGSAVLSQIFVGEIFERTARAACVRPPAGSAIDRADLVFVQVPLAGVQDSTSAALSRYLLDGVRYIVGHARRGVTRKIVINISTATSRTAHDGTSMVERAFSEWVDHARDGLDVDLAFVLAAGNTNQEQRHAVLSDSSYALQLFIPPDNEMPQYVTVRWPSGSEGVRLRVTPPDGPPVEVAHGEAWALQGPRGEQAGVISPPPPFPGRPARSLLAFAPTASHDVRRALAPSGRWRIELANAAALEADPVSFWISRNQRNPGALRRSRQADFVDWSETHNPMRYLRRTESVAPEQLGLRNGIRRRGALSGLATAARSDGRVVVVAASFRQGAHRDATPYTAAGPAAGASARRAGPDFSAPGDTDRACIGVLVRGNLSGTVVSVSGTSFSAPVVTRALVNGQPYASTPLIDGPPSSPRPVKARSVRSRSNAQGWDHRSRAEPDRVGVVDIRE